MKKQIIIFFTFVLLSSCAHNNSSDLLEKEANVPLVLKWNKAYPDDTIEQSIIGLKWALSYVGASLPQNQIGILYQNNLISLDLGKIGFLSNALEKLNILHTKIINSNEYQINQTIDMGRYIALLLGSSEHYYQIIGTPKTLQELLNKYTLLPEKGYVNNSTVSFEHRIIEFSEQNGFNQLFLSTEIDPNTNEITEYETIELLENGQLRFGIYDIFGQRKISANPLHTAGGKPAKCMWCHESGINPMFSVQNEVSGFLSFENFQNKLLSFRESNTALKLQLTDGVDYSQTQQHNLTELLYISFMEPSAERLSLEWNLPLNQIQVLLTGLETHQHNDFPFLGNLYFRKNIETFAPFQGLQVSGDVREPTDIEVNHLN